MIYMEEVLTRVNTFWFTHQLFGPVKLQSVSHNGQLVPCILMPGLFLLLCSGTGWSCRGRSRRIHASVLQQLVYLLPWA